MKENKLKDLSMEFSVDIIRLVRQLKAEHETIISDQIGKSGTSIGANIHEAQYAQSKMAFISKFAQHNIISPEAMHHKIPVF